MRKVLVVNVNWIGDVIFSSPVFKAIKDHYGSCALTCMAVPRVKDVLESNPYIDKVIAYEEKGKHASPIGKMKLIRDLSRERFDEAFLLHGSLTRALLVFLAGIPVRVGYPTKNRGVFLTHKTESPKEACHRSDNYLRVIESYGVPVNDRKVFFNVDQEIRQQAREILARNGILENQKFVVMHVGGNWNLKRWPEDCFAELARKIAEDESLRVVISGTPQDKDLIERVKTRAGSRAVSLCGQTDLKQLAAVMQESCCVISSDSGPMHLAAGVGANVVAVFGPTRPEITGPRGRGRTVILQNDVGCNRDACYHLACQDNICMQSVTVEDVYHAFQQTQSS